MRCVFTIAWLYIFPTIFKLPLGVYQRVIYSLCLLQLLVFHWNITWLLGTKIAWMMNISANIRQVYRHIITRTVCQGIYILLLLLLHDGALMLTYFHWKYSLYTMLKCPQELCIQNVYTWYIFGKHLSTTCIQYVYIAFPFSQLPIRPLYFYTFSNITSSYCPSRLRMLACG